MADKRITRERLMALLATYQFSQREPRVVDEDNCHRIFRESRLVLLRLRCVLRALLKQRLAMDGEECSEARVYAKLELSGRPAGKVFAHYQIDATVVDLMLVDEQAVDIKSEFPSVRPKQTVKRRITETQGRESE